MLLNGKTVIITGASRGLGEQIARTFHRQGASLFLTGRSKEELARLANELRGTSFVVSDLRDPVAPEAIMTEARRRWEKLDVLVNNAAMIGPIGNSWDNDWDAWQVTLRVNLLAPVALCRMAVACMPAGGSIINVSGGGATGPRPRFSAYATAKAGLVRFGETLAQETAGLGIRVNSIAPGVMNTRMIRDVIEAGPQRAGADFERAVELEKKGGASPETAAELALFLASAASGGITGRLISAVWDPWQRLGERTAELAKSEIYTLRRIVPAHCGKEW
jgi:3-oxoacyl-[acyl-carrier protein] reductase